MANHLKLTLIFDAGKEVVFHDQDALVDGVADLLLRKFPNHSGTLMICDPVDEDGNPVKP